ncbi:hypothetical protein BDV96DRAFT_577388 [Lophiotrema nucula]|uniref:TMEM205-like domain-containing protein n=1 Tax=Lophiotrema nucula TaxID=690887 RepID=A0A6A5Z3J3_9PLEO|nr:hypothetical protein BDV96DRAFT_577388 [Lophiotrema nucula]
MALTGILNHLPSPASILAPLHILAYSALLGTELYQSFIMTKIAHQALPRSAFTTLQKRIFPIYFRIQSLLLIVTAITYPSRGPLSLFQQKQDWIPWLVAGLTASLNLFIYGPRTRQIMIDRIHQETIDGRKHADLEGTTPDMLRLNRAFSGAHAMSIHLNIITIGATLWYGWRLASKLKFDST